ncbi:unnamed protein product, partial [Brachionus calyciflorus]
ITIETGDPKAIPRVDLKRQERINLLLRIQMFLMRYYILIALFIIGILISYSYFSIYPINTIFFKYGHPSDINLKENDLLTKVEFIDIKLKGPEAITFDKNGSLFTGLRNGLIVRVDPDGHVEKIIRTGDEVDDHICDDESKWNLAVPPCGRPFGLRMKPNSNYLYVADSFYGIIKINVIEKTKQIILHSNDTRFGNRPLKSPEDLDIEGDDIYFVDSTDKHSLNEAIEDIIFSYPSGRLFRYNEKLDQLDLLLDHLYFPNGVQLTPKKDALLINEFSYARIIKYFVEGDMKGKSEVFIELPGLSDAIRLTELDTLLFINPSVIMNIWPKYGLVVEYDMNGNILKSWHDKTGKKVKFTTNAVLHDKKLYLGSYTGDKIAIVNY